MSSLEIYFSKELGIFELLTSDGSDKVNLPMACIDGYDGGELEAAKTLKVFLEKLGHSVYLQIG